MGIVQSIAARVARSKLKKIFEGKKAYLVLASGLLMIADQLFGTNVAGEIDLGSEGQKTAALVAAGIVDLALMAIKAGEQRHFRKLKALVENGGAALLLLAIVPLVGCATDDVVKVRRFDPVPAGTPITINATFEDGTAAVESTFLVGMLREEFIVKKHSSGRACNWTTVSAEGAIDTLTDVSGTDDYLGVAILPQMVKDAVAGALGAVNSTADVIGQVVGKMFGVEQKNPERPTEHGCGPTGIFEGAERPEEPEEEEEVSPAARAWGGVTGIFGDDSDGDGDAELPDTGETPEGETDTPE